MLHIVTLHLSLCQLTDCMFSSGVNALFIIIIIIIIIIITI